MGSGRPDYRQGHDLEAQAIDRLSTIAKAPTGSTIIAKSGLATGSTQILHTVPSGKTLHLTAATLALSSLNASYTGGLAVRDDSDVIQYYLLRATVRASTDNSANIAYSIPLVPPVEIPEGWDLVNVSPNVALSVSSSISGWEE